MSTVPQPWGTQALWSHTTRLVLGSGAGTATHAAIQALAVTACPPAGHPVPAAAGLTQSRSPCVDASMGTPLVRSALGAAASVERRNPNRVRLQSRCDTLSHAPAHETILSGDRTALSSRDVSAQRGTTASGVGSASSSSVVWSHRIVVPFGAERNKAPRVSRGIHGPGLEAQCHVKGSGPHNLWDQRRSSGHPRATGRRLRPQLLPAG